MKYITIIFIIITMLLFNGCVIPSEEATIKTVEIDQTSIPLNEVLIDEFNLSTIKLIVTKSDGTKETINVQSMMLSVDDQEQLTTAGTKTITVIYKGFKVTFTINLITNLKFTVVFKDKDGAVLKTEYVNQGSDAQAPTPPEITGYLFSGWNASFSNVTSDLEVTATYAIRTFKVIFKDEQGNELSNQTINYGTSATAPTPPEVAGYTFIGWDVEYVNITNDTVVIAKYQKNQPIDDYLYISEVKKKINQANEDGTTVMFVGKVIGFDSMGYAHLADSTGSIYVRATHPLLVLDSKVVIQGIGFIYRGSVGYPEYTRQIKAEGLEVSAYEGEISILNPQVLSQTDLAVSEETDYQNAFFHGNVVQITGIVKTGSSKYNFYLLNDNGKQMVGIHHYSTNFNNQITDANQNVFLKLNGKKVTLTGIMYRFYQTEMIWTLQCIGLEDELVVLDSTDDPTKTVNIVAINDTHGAFVTDRDNVGFEKVNTVIKTIEEANGAYIKIANGDIFQGSYISNIHYGRPLIDALNTMNFTAFVIGNHEFDWGIEEIRKYADGNLENGEANFPFLAANIINKTTNQKLPWTKDYVIVENNGFKVGIIGAIGQGLESSIATDKVKDYLFLDPVPIVSQLSALLRTEYDCDVVIVAIHEYNNYTNSRLSSLSGINRIDGIVCGHTHEQIAEYEYREDGYQVPVLQSYTKNRSVGEMIISFNTSNQMVNGSLRHYNPALYSDDQEVLNIIENYAEDIAAGNREIGYTVEYLSRYTIGGEMVKAMRAKYGSDIAIINTGGVRSDINQGIITVKDIYEVFPFDNKIIQTTISGAKLKDFLQKNGSYLYYNNLEIIESKTYTLVTIDYVFTNNYYASAFLDSIPHDPNTLMRDVFIEYIESFYNKL